MRGPTTTTTSTKNKGVPFFQDKVDVAKKKEEKLLCQMVEMATLTLHSTWLGVAALKAKFASDQ